MPSNGPTVSDDAHISFAKRLAHNNRDTRQAALKKVKRWLVTKSRQGSLDHGEIIKIWKGLHYSMWYSDKPLTQESLALDISQIVSLLPSIDDSISFFSGFCETMAREWVGIDRQRLDKFYMFIKTALKCVLEFCAANSWDAKIVNGVVDTLDVRIINSECPDSIAVFISENVFSIYSEIANDSTPPLFISELLSCYIEMLSKTHKKDLSRVLMSNLFTPIISKTVDIAVDYEKLISLISDLAVQPEILTRNRKFLYRLRNDIAETGGVSPAALSPLGKHKREEEEETVNDENISSNVQDVEMGEPKKKKKKKKKKKVVAETGSEVNENGDSVTNGSENGSLEEQTTDHETIPELPVEGSVSENTEEMEVEEKVEQTTTEDKTEDTKTTEKAEGTVEETSENVAEEKTVCEEEPKETVSEDKTIDVVEEEEVTEETKTKDFTKEEKNGIVTEEDSEVNQEDVSPTEESSEVSGVIEKENILVDTPVADTISTETALEDESKVNGNVDEREGEDTAIETLPTETAIAEPDDTDLPAPELETPAKKTPKSGRRKSARTKKTPKKAAEETEVQAENFEVETNTPQANDSVQPSPKLTRSVKKRKKKSIGKTPVLELAPTTVASDETSTTKKKVRLSMENNQTFFFKKNTSLESPKPYDSTRTPVKGVLKASPALTRSQARKKAQSRVKH